MRDHRNLIKEIIEFVGMKYLTHALQVVSITSDLDLEHDQFHWYGTQKDFDYEKIHPDVIKVFMALKKIKKFKLPKHHSLQMRALQQNPVCKDQIMSFEHICEYYDAVLFGASELFQILAISK